MEIGFIGLGAMGRAMAVETALDGAPAPGLEPLARPGPGAGRARCRGGRDSGRGLPRRRGRHHARGRRRLPGRRTGRPPPGPGAPGDDSPQHGHGFGGAHPRAGRRARGAGALVRRGAGLRPCRRGCRREAQHRRLGPGGRAGPGSAAARPDGPAHLAAGLGPNPGRRRQNRRQFHDRLGDRDHRRGHDPGGPARRAPRDAARAPDRLAVQRSGVQELRRHHCRPKIPASGVPAGSRAQGRPTRPRGRRRGAGSRFRSRAFCGTPFSRPSPTATAISIGPPWPRSPGGGQASGTARVSSARRTVPENRPGGRRVILQL